MTQPLHLEVEALNGALLLPANLRAQYLDRTCEGDAGLRSRVEALLRAHEAAGEFLEQPAGDARLFSPVPPGGGGGETGESPTPLVTNPGDRIGHYRLVEKIGEGGCGMVYLAEQEWPVRRRVALKVIKLGMDTRSVIARFEVERQALALMEHPNIARVFDAGATENGRPFFVMEWVRGVRITEYCDRGSLPLVARLQLFTRVCRAIHHAHQKGIIHRDIKPSNVLVSTEDGQAVPKVIDFGIAKATQSRLTNRTVLTGLEPFIGTPAYMSPEQSALTGLDVDTRSDIYSLGVLLYELLTGRTPFEQGELLARGLEEMRRLICHQEPMRPSIRLCALAGAELSATARRRGCEPARLIHRVRGDLDWLVMKCLDKDRARRYETANDLACDVERFLANEPISAGPPGNLYRVRKFVRRNKVMFTTISAVAAALVVGLGISTWQFLEKSRAEREQDRMRQRAEQAQANEAESRRRAEAQELAARRKAYASDMNLLQSALAADDLGRAQDRLNRQRPHPGEPDLRGWEWRYFWQFCQSDVAYTLCQRSNSITSISFSPDGLLLAVGTLTGDVTVWDVAARELVFERTPETADCPARLGFAPHGNLLAYSDHSGTGQWVVLWDAQTRSEVNRLPLEGALRDLAFSEEGRLFTADSSHTNNIAIWRVPEGKLQRRFTERIAGHEAGRVFNVSSAGDRMVLAGFNRPQLARVLEVDGHERFSIRVGDELVTALAFSPGEQYVVSGAGYADGDIRIWDVGSGELVDSLRGHRSWVSSLRFLADGRTLASASADRTIRLWDFKTRRLLRTLRGHSGELWNIDVSRDGSWLASGCKDGSVMFWDLASSTHRPPIVRLLQPGGVERWKYAPDGRSFGAVRLGVLQFYDATTLQPVEGMSFTNVHAFDVSADHRWLALASPEGNLALWDFATGSGVTNHFAHADRLLVREVMFAEAGTGLLTFSADGTMRQWDPVTGNEIRRWSDLFPPGTTLAASSNLVARAAVDGLVELVSTRGRRRRQLTGPGRLSSLGLSGDGKLLAAASENGLVELWDTATLRRSAVLRGVLLGYHSVAISPDGLRLAAAGDGEEAVKVWDLASHEDVATLPGQGSFFSQVQFSPDGRTIGARNWSGVIHFWTAPSGEQIEAAEYGRGALASAPWPARLAAAHSTAPANEGKIP